MLHNTSRTYTSGDYNVITGGLILLATIFLSSLLVAVYHTVSALFLTSWSTFFSIIVPVAALVLAVLVIIVKHPVHSLLALINVFFMTVLLYLSVKAEFLAFIFLIVYVGAIAILFLFVIMLLNVKELTAAPRQKFELTQLVALHMVGPFSLILSFKLINALDMFLQKSDILYSSTEQTSIIALINYVNYQFVDIQLFSSLLYTEYSSAFMFTALLLLTAMLGAIILASSATDTETLD